MSAIHILLFRENIKFSIQSLIQNLYCYRFGNIYIFIYGRFKYLSYNNSFPHPILHTPDATPPPLSPFCNPQEMLEIPIEMHLYCRAVILNYVSM